MNEFKLLALMPLAMVANRLTWHTLSKEEKDEMLRSMWISIIAVDNPLLLKGMKSMYDWCIENY